MADAQWRKNIPEGYDGRFGDQFDDEIAPKPILQISIGILVLVIAAVAICLVILRGVVSGIRAAEEPRSPIAEANERQLPSAPLLQSHPEGELVQMKAEVAAHLDSFGWVDEAHGVAHLPIETAIDLVATGHLPTSINSSLEAPVATEGEDR